MTSDPTREAIIEGLVRAIDWIKPEPGMDGPHGGYIGGVTRQRAVTAIDAALEYLTALATTPAPLDVDRDWHPVDPSEREHWQSDRAALSTTPAPLDAFIAAVNARSPISGNLAVPHYQDVERIWTAIEPFLALSTTPAPLDVERLARALAMAEINCWANPTSGHKSTDVDEDRAHREDAEAIAREYAKP
jgi:hypothetical protein